MIKSRRGKPVFTNVKTIYIDLKTEEVNLVGITAYIKHNWGDEYHIVTTEGVELEDSSVTQGIYYIYSTDKSNYYYTNFRTCFLEGIKQETMLYLIMMKVIVRMMILCLHLQRRLKGSRS